MRFSFQRTRLLFHYRLILIAGFFLVLHNEYLSYWFDTFYWSTLPDNSCSSNNCTKLLIIADPQILGYTSEPAFLGVLTRWDSDRYLEKSFSHVLRYVQPDAVLFLGDLIDEGSIATDDDFTTYQKRFHNLFNTDSYSSQALYIPGDNDIGGEGVDIVTEEKESRFSAAFPTKTQTVLNSLVLIPVSRLLPSYSFPSVLLEENQWRVVLSHVPITYIYGEFSKKVLEHLKPHVIFSAHNHRGSMAIARLNPYSFHSEDIFDSRVHHIQLNNTESVEIIWPTCSYRMGEARTAYGVANIGPDGSMNFTFLWLHSRFASLISYVVFLVLVLVLLYCWKRRS